MKISFHTKSFLLFSLIMSCFMTKISAQKSLPDNLLAELLAQKPEFFGTIMAKKDEHNIQLIYTQIDRDKKNKEDKMRAEINQVIATLKEAPLKIGAKPGTSGKIFGSVTALPISRAIRDQKGYEIDRKKSASNGEVKELGTYTATIDFGNGQNADVEFAVVGE